MYESKLALLVKLASSRRGAETVLAQGALARLAELRALHHHPDIHAAPARRDTDFVPAVGNRSVLVYNVYASPYRACV